MSAQGKGKGGKKNHPSLPYLVDDLCARFVLNVPREELQSFPRLVFQMELAHWFYEDHYRENDESLPSFNIREFVQILFSKCRLLQKYESQVDEILLEWVQYKIRVPVFGVIVLNKTLDKVLLVKGFQKGATWGFPKGKMNQNEPGIDCAVREAWEEVGLDLAGQLNENDVLEAAFNQQKVKMYIAQGVPEDYDFQPQMKGEISKIKWHDVRDLPRSYQDGKNKDGTSNGKNPNHFYTVVPFVNSLRAWLKKKAKAGNSNVKKTQNPNKVAKKEKAANINAAHVFSPLKRSAYADDASLTPPVVRIQKKDEQKGETIAEKPAVHPFLAFKLKPTISLEQFNSDRLPLSFDNSVILERLQRRTTELLFKMNGHSEKPELSQSGSSKPSSPKILRGSENELKKSNPWLNFKLDLENAAKPLENIDQ